LTEILDRLKPMVREAGLEFVAKVDNDLPEVLGDRRRIEQVVSNLVTNAAKYGLSGRRVEVTVSGGAELVIQVRDFGPGITPEDQEKLFKPFFRSRAHRRVGGLGIGLSLVSDIVQAHHGTISVWSQEGQGALFTVRLPAVRAGD
jgi:two-component system phosphate regulon sensor histidine kinase PhoR